MQTNSKGMTEGTSYEDLPLEEQITRARRESRIDILNNAQQVWNHAFLWEKPVR